jgi:hypothetical protein
VLKVLVDAWKQQQQKQQQEQQQTQQQEQQQEQQQKQNGWISQLLRRFYSTVRETEESTAETEETVHTSSGDDFSLPKLVDWNDGILNLDLAVECCQYLLDHAPPVLLAHGTDPNFALLGWLQQHNQDTNKTQIQSLLCNLPLEQINLLLQVLEQTGHAKRQDDLLILGTNTIQDHQLHTARFRLQYAIHQTETNIHNWTIQRDDCLNKALLFKKSHGTNKALQQLQRKALYQQHLDAAHGRMLNLEQTLQALEMAHSHQQLMTALQETVTVLTTIQPDDVDQLVLDLQEEYQHLELVTQSLSAQHEEQHEEQLLLELQALTLQDDKATTNISANQSDIMDTTTSNESTDKENKLQTKEALKDVAPKKQAVFQK